MSGRPIKRTLRAPLLARTRESGVVRCPSWSSCRLVSLGLIQFRRRFS